MSDLRAVVVCKWIGTPKHLLIVADSIVVMVACAAPTTDSNQINRIPFTVAVASRDVSTSALVNRTRTVADATCVEFTHAVVYVITNAISVSISRARPSTDS
jgi:hypothetical protein